MKDLIFKMIDMSTKGVDVYNNNGSMWLIFTDQKKWVIELTDSGTLWYNYYFFEDCLKYFSLDISTSESNDLIKEWVTDRFLKRQVDYTIQNGVKHTEYGDWEDGDERLDDIIQNGVKDTDLKIQIGTSSIENGVKDIVGIMNEQRVGLDDTIQTGIKETKQEEHHRLREVVQTVKNGVKETESIASHRTWKSDEVIQNGIKNTINHPARPQEVVDKVLENGVKEIKKGGFNQHYDMFGAIENGIKEVKTCELHSLMRADHIIGEGIKQVRTPGDGDIVSTMEFMNDNNTSDIPKMLDGIIRDGIKETIELPDKSGELNGYGEYYSRKKDRTYSHDDIVNGILNNSVKEILPERSHRTWKSGQVIDESPINGTIKNVICGVLEIINPIDSEPETKEMKRMNEVMKVINNTPPPEPPSPMILMPL